MHINGIDNVGRYPSLWTLIIVIIHLRILIIINRADLNRLVPFVAF